MIQELEVSVGKARNALSRTNDENKVKKALQKMEKQEGKAMAEIAAVLNRLKANVPKDPKGLEPVPALKYPNHYCDGAMLLQTGKAKSVAEITATDYPLCDWGFICSTVILRWAIIKLSEYSQATV